jgi:hypothetical protein
MAAMLTAMATLGGATNSKYLTHDHVQEVGDD